MNRKTKRRELFDSHFQRFDGDKVPKGLDSRKERRKLARAFAARDWKAVSRG